MDYFVDALGDMCPIPIMKAEKVLKKINVSDRVILETDHSCSIASVKSHFTSKYSCSVEINEVEEGVWNIIIEKLNK